METNGKTAEPQGERRPANHHAVRVHRIETPGGQFVRMLSPDYKGLFTHYMKGRSHYCVGESCRIPTHATDRTWKGYVAAELLLRAPKPVWVPICLEITEYLELDFRDIYARGQLWELYKQDDGKGKKAAVTGRLHPDPAPAELRKPFDIIPCLRSIYHRDVIDLKHPSPLPARVYLPEVEGNLPEVLCQPDPASQASPLTFKQMQEELQRKKAEQNPSPTLDKKKKGY